MSIISIILLAAGFSAACLACYSSKQCERLARSLTYSEYEKEKSAVKCEELEKALIDNNAKKWEKEIELSQEINNLKSELKYTINSYNKLKQKVGK